MSRFRRPFFLRPTKNVNIFIFLLSSQDEKNVVQYCFRWKDIEEENYAGTRLSPLDFFGNSNQPLAIFALLPLMRIFSMDRVHHPRQSVPMGGQRPSQGESLARYWEQAMLLRAARPFCSQGTTCLCQPVPLQAPEGPKPRPIRGLTFAGDLEAKVC